ncbi:hypothetical protein [Coleofasciculus sp. H7-2]
MSELTFSALRYRLYHNHQPKTRSLLFRDSNSDRFRKYPNPLHIL